jgi:hypothetical protein
MATTWAATANNQAVTRQALQNAIDTNQLNYGNAFIPTTEITKCVNRFDAEFLRYVGIDTPIGVASNQLLVKQNFLITPTYEYAVAIGGRRNGGDVYVYIDDSTIIASEVCILDSTTCTVYGAFGGYANGDTITITVKNLSNQNIKFWMTEGGVTCPTGGTEYSSFVYTATSKRNFLIVPVWTGSSYVLV